MPKINHRKEEAVMPCPHHDIKIVQRSSRQSAVAPAVIQPSRKQRLLQAVSTPYFQLMIVIQVSF
ncbi:hypothetical protein FYJ45_20400 [Eisenbergiella tayi]|uniref:Uncharacterized protein n=1 Tax=Eisenbergiella porci TaxID=2652274 RepID=A0A6N7WM97_9FIRM|nr:hypothetical protein [Eisenbergiella porci]